MTQAQVQISADAIHAIRKASGILHTAIDLLQIARRAQRIAQEQGAVTIQRGHVDQALEEFGKEKNDSIDRD